MVAVLRGQLPKLRQELSHRRFAAVSIGEQLAVEKWLALTAEADAARQAVAAILSRAGAEQLAALVTLEKLRGDGRALDSTIRAFLEYELPAVAAATAPAVFAADPAAACRRTRTRPGPGQSTKRIGRSRPRRRPRRRSSSPAFRPHARPQSHQPRHRLRRLARTRRRRIARSRRSGRPAHS